MGEGENEVSRATRGENKVRGAVANIPCWRWLVGAVVVVGFHGGERGEGGRSVSCLRAMAQIAAEGEERDMAWDSTISPKK